MGSEVIDCISSAGDRVADGGVNWSDLRIDVTTEVTRFLEALTHKSCLNCTALCLPLLLHIISYWYLKGAFPFSCVMMQINEHVWNLLQSVHCSEEANDPSEALWT
jgi:hypothetical protein